MEFPAKIKIHEVTLRDGKKQAGIEFNKDEKVAIAEKVAELEVHRIEAELPVVCKQDEEAITDSLI